MPIGAVALSSAGLTPIGHLLTKTMKTIQLTQGKVALVDDEDFEALNQFRWYADKAHGNRFYACRDDRDGAKQTKIYMHAHIIQTPRKMHTDHINGEGLDNRRANLRVATPSQNLMNRGSNKNSKLGVKGVSPHRRRYMAMIKINGKSKYLGLFLTIEAASAAYQAASQQVHGEFAKIT
jgi:hypothetical protein